MHGPEDRKTPSLAAAFWGWVIISNVIGFAGMAIIERAFDVGPPRNTAIAVLFTVLTAYNVFAVYRIWRAAAVYLGNRLWSVLARALSALGLLAWLWLVWIFIAYGLGIYK